MRNRISTRKITATGMILATALTGSIAPLALAQTPAADNGTGETVVITGSNIARSDYEGPQSTIIYDSKKIERTGARTVTEVLQKLPQNTAGFTEAVNTGLSFSPGAAAASLRGLGVSATLVLINGRRVAPFPLAQNGTDVFVDLNGIPLSAVDRIEILKEGASAIYGSDAIAGVINVILKTNYTGLEVETYYGNTTNKDSGEVRESFVSGFANEKFHIMVTGNYLHRNPLADLDRSFSESADHRRQSGLDLRSVRSDPGTIFFSGSAAFPDGVAAVPPGGNGRTNVPGFNPNTYFLPGILPDGNFRNRFDFNKHTELISETERWGGYMNFGYTIFDWSDTSAPPDGKAAKSFVPKVGPKLELFGETSYQSIKSVTRIAPTPPDSAGDNIFVPATNPYNPFGEDVQFLWRAVEAGPRRDRVETDDYRYVGGLKLTQLPRNWNAELSFLYTENNVVDHSYAGFLSVEKVQAALNDTNPATALNVFGDGPGINNPETIKGLVVKPRNDGIAYIYSEDFKASGDLINLPAGPIKLAVGGEYREEALSQSFSVSAGSIVGFGGPGSDGDRDIRSLFYEVAIPITSDKWNVPGIRSLEFSIAQRYDDYSDFGDTVQPKFGFAWKPVKGLLFRGTYSGGFRAPSLPELFTRPVISIETFEGDFGPPFKTRTRTTTGGNPNLKPETSYGYLLGFVAEPPFIPGLSISMDLYRIKRHNVIGQPTEQFIADNFPDEVVYNDFGDTLDIDINLRFRNLGEVVTDGVDFDLTYRLETKIGTFILDSEFAFINSLEQIATPGTANQEFADTFAIPEFKMVNRLTYTNGGLELEAAVNYIDSYDDAASATGQIHKVGSWTTVDLRASYEFNFTPEELPNYSKHKNGKSFKETVPGMLTGWKKWLSGTKFTVGWLNVGDADPSFSNIDEGYDTSTADPTGRFYYASIRKKFW
jgi:iron complex outermembrane receptor protein